MAAIFFVFVWVNLLPAIACKLAPLAVEGIKNSSINCKQLVKVDRDKQMCLVNSTCSYNSGSNNSVDSDCPVWFNCTEGKCECYPGYSDIVQCNLHLQSASVVDCFCVTQDPESGEIVVGSCVEMCAHPHNGDLVDNVYHHLPKSTLQFNEKICAVSNRAGILCGSCKNNTYPLVYSYNHTCVSSDKCGSKVLECFKYIVAAYGPLTVFYTIVLVFQINVTSSYLHGFIIFSQVLTVPMQMRVILSAMASRRLLSQIMRVMISFFAIWNLDFFRSFYNETICFQIDSMTLTALNYLVAVYPLILSILSYYLIDLYDRDIKLIVFLWRPMKYVLSVFHNNWKSRTTVIDAYATFFLLSYTKVLETSFNLLAPTILYHMRSNSTSLVLFFDGTVEYFSHRHLPYAVLAIFFFVIVNVVPIVVLLLYQCSFFQAILSKLPLRMDILHTFMDLLQGCYKNGSSPNSWDLRWFCAVFLIGRVLLFLLFAVALNGMFFVYGMILYLSLFMLIMLVQPFKEEFSHFAHTNTISILFVALVYACIIGINIAAVVEVGGIIIEFYFVASFTVVTPVIYMCACTIHWLVTHCKLWPQQRFLSCD